MKCSGFNYASYGKEIILKIMLAATSVDAFSGAAKCLLDIALEIGKRGHEVIVALPRKSGDIVYALDDRLFPMYWFGNISAGIQKKQTVEKAE